MPKFCHISNIVLSSVTQILLILYSVTSVAVLDSFLKTVRKLKCLKTEIIFHIGIHVKQLHSLLDSRAPFE